MQNIFNQLLNHSSVAFDINYNTFNEIMIEKLSIVVINMINTQKKDKQSLVN